MPNTLTRTITKPTLWGRFRGLIIVIAILFFGGILVFSGWNWITGSGGTVGGLFSIFLLTITAMGFLFLGFGYTSGEKMDSEVLLITLLALGATIALFVYGPKYMPDLFSTIYSIANINNFGNAFSIIGT